MSDHFTLRFRAGTEERLKRRARSTGDKPRSLAARYVDEGVRRDEHPLIDFADGPSGRRARVLGTKLDVWEIIATVRDNQNDVAETADYLGILPGAVDAAVTYYGEFKDEVDSMIDLNNEESERAHLGWLHGRQALES